MPLFERYLGIDYSGAKTSASRLPGLRVFAARAGQLPLEIRPGAEPRTHWTRRGLAEWLINELRDGPPTLVGIDHAFSFPIRYFEFHQLPLDWPAFLEDFQRHWPADEDQISIEGLRRGRHGRGAARVGDSRWRRLTEKRCRAKSVFHFDVPGSVAKSTHAGLPWLRMLREALHAGVHFWPFDGWRPVRGHSVIVEIYPALCSGKYPRAKRSADQHDAYCAARWMVENDSAGTLRALFQPGISAPERSVAKVEGWILGLA